MPTHRTRRAPLTLSSEQREHLTQISRSQTAAVREVQRTRILLSYARDPNITAIQKALNVTRPTIYKCIDKALTMGVEAGLKDAYHRPKDPVITEEAKSWVVNRACQKPKDHGYAAEVWSLQQLANDARKHGVAEGHDCLKSAGKATIHRILKAQPLQPHKQRYYLERRDPEFEQKMQEVLLVYREVHLWHESGATSKTLPVYTVSIDEKPGIQAIENTAPDLPPKVGKHPTWSRDHEYIRHGTLSLLAALDLHTGHILAEVHPRHRSCEFITLLKDLDAYYPSNAQIRILLDNHSAHISKETRAWLSTRPNRFIYVHTPKHGSWLNIVETLFGKMARTFLKHIRVRSKAELKERILKGIEEINAAPVVHRWKKFGELQCPLA